MEVKRADLEAQSDYRRGEKRAAIDRWTREWEEIRSAGDALTVAELAVSGKDLIAMGMRPGTQVGEMLRSMLDDVLEFPEHNTRVYLLENLANKGLS